MMMKSNLAAHWIFPIAISGKFSSHIAALEINPVMPVQLAIGDLSIDWRQTIPSEAFRGGELIHVGVLGGKLEKIGVAIILDCRQEIMLNDGSRPKQAMIDEDWWLKQYPDEKSIGHIDVDTTSIKIEISAGCASLQTNIFTVYEGGKHLIYPIAIEDIGHGFFIDFE